MESKVTPYIRFRPILSSDYSLPDESIFMNFFQPSNTINQNLGHRAGFVLCAEPCLKVIKDSDIDYMPISWAQYQMSLCHYHKVDRQLAVSLKGYSDLWTQDITETQGKIHVARPISLFVMELIIDTCEGYQLVWRPEYKSVMEIEKFEKLPIWNNWYWFKRENNTDIKCNIADLDLAPELTILTRFIDPHGYDMGGQSDDNEYIFGMLYTLAPAMQLKINYVPAFWHEESFIGMGFDDFMSLLGYCADDKKFTWEYTRKIEKHLLHILQQQYTTPANMFDLIRLAESYINNPALYQSYLNEFIKHT